MKKAAHNGNEALSRTRKMCFSAWGVAEKKKWQRDGQSHDSFGCGIEKATKFYVQSDCTSANSGLDEAEMHHWGWLTCSRQTSYLQHLGPASREGHQILASCG